MAHALHGRPRVENVNDAGLATVRQAASVAAFPAFAHKNLRRRCLLKARSGSDFLQENLAYQNVASRLARRW
jgi:hypothetical protein